VDIVNPLSGERITIVAVDPSGAALDWELVLASGGRVPSSHSHPRQEERFAVLEGRMRFRIGLGWFRGRSVLAGPGDVVVVPPGTTHHFANPGPGPARVSVRTAPALGMRELLETSAALAREQHAAGRALPRLSSLVLFMRDFEAEVAAPVFPRVVRLAVRWLGLGVDRYRRVRRDARY